MQYQQSELGRAMQQAASRAGGNKGRASNSKAAGYGEWLVGPVSHIYCYTLGQQLVQDSQQLHVNLGVRYVKAMGNQHPV
jgi:hypothetical protein